MFSLSSVSSVAKVSLNIHQHRSLDMVRINDDLDGEEQIEAVNFPWARSAEAR